MPPTNQSRVRRFIFRALLILILLPFALYGVLLALQTYSAWQAARTLDRLEALRLGDPASDFDKAVRSCKWEFGTHTLTAGAYRFDLVWTKLWNVAPSMAESLRYALDLAGLHYWRLNAADSVQEGRIVGLSLGLMAVGRGETNRGETFGASWRMASAIPERCLRHLSNKGSPTCVSSFAIDSDPGGVGYHFFLTDRSSARDLSARSPNRSCLFPFHSCKSIFEVLPKAHGLITEQNVSVYSP
jgi:hypothetical protein